jgi:transcriptional regulator with XRE-family HTH domain
MTRLNLIDKVADRKEKLGITLENLSKLTHLGNRTVNRFFAGEDVKLSTVEKITNVLGLDFAGNEVLNINELINKRAEEKALYIVSLVQDTSALEMQGLEANYLNLLIKETKEQFLNGEYKKELWAN